MPEKAVETHLFSNNLDVPPPASCRHKGTDCFRTRIARALIVASCPNEKDGSPAPPKLAHAGIAHDCDAPHAYTPHRLTFMMPNAKAQPAPGGGGAADAERRRLQRLLGIKRYEKTWLRLIGYRADNFFTHAEFYRVLVTARFKHGPAVFVCISA